MAPTKPRRDSRAWRAHRHIECCVEDLVMSSGDHYLAMLRFSAGFIRGLGGVGLIVVAAVLCQIGKYLLQRVVV